MGKRIEEIDPASLATLAAYAWPGNVRELRNVIERAMILASGPTLLIEGPPRQPGETERTGHPMTDGRDDLRRYWKRRVGGRPPSRARNCTWRCGDGRRRGTGLQPRNLEEG
jgi:DNA-binding NtrC family response regulator